MRLKTTFGADDQDAKAILDYEDNSIGFFCEEESVVWFLGHKGINLIREVIDVYDDAMEKGYIGPDDDGIGDLSELGFRWVDAQGKRVKLVEHKNSVVYFQYSEGGKIYDLPADTFISIYSLE